MTLRKSAPKAAPKRKKRRADISPPEIPLHSSDDVRSVMKAGGIGSELLQLVEQFLRDLQKGYLRELDHLGWYASDKKIDEGLTIVLKCADALSRAVGSKAIRDKLFISHMLSDQRPSTDYAECQPFFAKFDADIAAVIRIRELARAALKRQDIDAKTSPNQAWIPTAKKPEYPYLAAQIVKFWTVTLGRKESGDDGRYEISFGVAIFDSMPFKTLDRKTVRAHLLEARKSRDAAHRITDAGVKEK